MELTKLKWLLVFLVCLQCTNTISGLICCQSLASGKDKECKSTCTADNKEVVSAIGSSGLKPACMSQKITTKKEDGKEIIVFNKLCSTMPPSGGCTEFDDLLGPGTGHVSSCHCDTDKCNQDHASATSSAPNLNIRERLTPKLLVGTIGLAIFFNFYLVNSA